MKQFFYEIDVNKFSFIDIVKLLLMPKNKYNWSSWNFIKTKDDASRLTYWMNYLQNIQHLWTGSNI